MTDRRRHRGAHPKDPAAFADARMPKLHEAVNELLPTHSIKCAREVHKDRMAPRLSERADARSEGPHGIAAPVTRSEPVLPFPLRRPCGCEETAIDDPLCYSRQYPHNVDGAVGGWLCWVLARLREWGDADAVPETRPLTLCDTAVKERGDEGEGVQLGEDMGILPSLPRPGLPTQDSK